MSEFEALAEKAEKDFDLGEFARAVRACRSYRRFDEGDPVPEALLIELVDLARVVASGANRMPLRYRIVSAAAERDTVFAQLKWAGALPEWDGPETGERPTGYIVVCDAGHGATTPVDEGIAAQTILLAATQAGYGGCMLHAFNKAGVSGALGLEAAGVAPLMVIALGHELLARRGERAPRTQALAGRRPRVGTARQHAKRPDGVAAFGPLALLGMVLPLFAQRALTPLGS